MTKHIALDPKTGLSLRIATAAEAQAYTTQACRHPSFRKPILVGDVLIDEDTGPGVSHIPGRFLP